jgi:hypothetical protein
MLGQSDNAGLPAIFTLHTKPENRKTIGSLPAGAVGSVDRQFETGIRNLPREAPLG